MGMCIAQTMGSLNPKFVCVSSNFTFRKQSSFPREDVRVIWILIYSISMRWGRHVNTTHHKGGERINYSQEHARHSPLLYLWYWTPRDRTTNLQTISYQKSKSHIHHNCTLVVHCSDCVLLEELDLAPFPNPNVSTYFCPQSSYAYLTLQQQKQLTHWGRGHLNCLNALSRGFFFKF